MIHWYLCKASSSYGLDADGSSTLQALVRAHSHAEAERLLQEELAEHCPEGSQYIDVVSVVRRKVEEVSRQQLAEDTATAYYWVKLDYREEGELGKETTRRLLYLVEATDTSDVLESMKSLYPVGAGLEDVVSVQRSPIDTIIERELAPAEVKVYKD